jgi:diguanylate cyclase
MLPHDTDDQWEDAYRGLVAELESKERRWTEVEADLRQAATALAIAAMGKTETLNGLLEHIIETTRDATDLLGPDIEALKSAMRKDPSLAAASVTDDQAASAATTADSTESILDLRIIISALTRRLAAIPDLGEVAKQIEAQCDNSDWSAALTNIADSIAQVVSSLQAQRTELEEFLAGVTAQLAGFERWARWHLNDTAQRRDENANLEAALTHQMDDLSATVEATDDISNLKSAVQTRLQAVTASVRKYTEIEARRLSEAQTRNAELTGEVNRLQKRTSELSEICGDQQNRLMVDALTRVHSRYAYEARLQQDFARWRDSGVSLAYTLWDIDKFKSINDTFGHDAGDRLLRRIGLIFNKHKRREDFAARIGGEEFVVLLPGAGTELALATAERLREIIASTPFNYRGTPRQITISCGVTELRQGDTPVSVYKRADQALYEAKTTGRNRVITL